MGSKGRSKEEAKKWFDEHISSHLTSVAKQRAKRKNIPFNITPEDVVVPNKCPLLGIELKRSRKNKGPSDSSPTLDRIYPEKGYVKGNVWVISAKANRIKTDASAREIKELSINLGYLKSQLLPDAISNTPKTIGVPQALYESILHSMKLPLDLPPSEFVNSASKIINKLHEDKELLARVEEGLEELAKAYSDRE